MIVGQIEEIRLDEPAREMYVADSYLGGRVMVFDLDTFAFKRGWGAYGKPLAEISGVTGEGIDGLLAIDRADPETRKRVLKELREQTLAEEPLSASIQRL